MTAKPKLAVWKFASCDGCQLSLLDCEDELLAGAGAVDIAMFPEATRRMAVLGMVEERMEYPKFKQRLKTEMDMHGSRVVYVEEEDENGEDSGEWVPVEEAPNNESWLCYICGVK